MKVDDKTHKFFSSNDKQAKNAATNERLRNIFCCTKLSGSVNMSVACR